MVPNIKGERNVKHNEEHIIVGTENNQKLLLNHNQCFAGKVYCNHRTFFAVMTLETVLDQDNLLLIKL